MIESTNDTVSSFRALHIDYRAQIDPHAALGDPGGLM
jgi:hypothetical protein